jgi:CheY-like chemotaxis protein
VYDAVSADQGLEMVRSHWPDVIMLDLRMPGMDGFEILEKLRADEAMAAIPVVMVTADDLNDAELMRLHGVAIYRKQELDPSDLIAYVASQLAW